LVPERHEESLWLSPPFSDFSLVFDVARKPFRVPVPRSATCPCENDNPITLLVLSPWFFFFFERPFCIHAFLLFSQVGFSWGPAVSREALEGCPLVRGSSVHSFIMIVSFLAFLFNNPSSFHTFQRLNVFLALDGLTPFGGSFSPPATLLPSCRFSQRGVTILCSSTLFQNVLAHPGCTPCDYPSRDAYSHLFLPDLINRVPLTNQYLVGVISDCRCRAHVTAKTRSIPQFDPGFVPEVPLHITSSCVVCICPSRFSCP